MTRSNSSITHLILSSAITALKRRGVEGVVRCMARRDGKSGMGGAMRWSGDGGGEGVREGVVLGVVSGSVVEIWWDEVGAYLEDEEVEEEKEEEYSSEVA